MKANAIVLLLMLLTTAGCRSVVPDDQVEIRDDLYYRTGAARPLNGVVRGLHASGRVAFEMRYRDGKQNGWSRSWHENGTLEDEVLYKDGTANGRYREWHPNGRLKSEGVNVTNIAVGTVTEWYPNGRKMAETLYTEDDGAVRTTQYHENGQRAWIGVWETVDGASGWTRIMEWDKDGHPLTNALSRAQNQAPGDTARKLADPQR